MEPEINQNGAPTSCCNMSKPAILSHMICFSYLFCLPLTVWGFYAFPNINFDYSKTLQNWYMPTITNIYASNLTSMCPTSLNFVPTYQWGGSVAGVLKGVVQQAIIVLIMSFVLPAQNVQ